MRSAPFAKTMRSRSPQTTSTGQRTRSSRNGALISGSSLLPVAIIRARSSRVRMWLVKAPTTPSSALRGRAKASTR